MGRGEARFGWSGGARPGAVRQVMARLGMVWHRRYGRLRSGGVRIGEVGHGGVWLARRGRVRTGEVRKGLAGRVR